MYLSGERAWEGAGPGAELKRSFSVSLRLRSSLSFAAGACAGTLLFLLVRVMSGVRGRERIACAWFFQQFKHVARRHGVSSVIMSRYLPRSRLSGPPWWKRVSFTLHCRCTGDRFGAFAVGVSGVVMGGVRLRLRFRPALDLGDGCGVSDVDADADAADGALGVYAFQTCLLNLRGNFEAELESDGGDVSASVVDSRAGCA